MEQNQAQDADFDSSDTFECPICGQRVNHGMPACPKCGLRFAPPEEEKRIAEPDPERAAIIMKMKAEQARYDTDSIPEVRVASANGYRRWYGLLMGLALGLVYGLVSQTINRILIPGVPLYQPPFGPLGNIFLTMLIGTVLGLINAWFETGATGVIVSSSVSAVMLLVASIISSNIDQSRLWAAAFTSALILLPLAGAAAVVMIALRWLINRGTSAYMEVRSGNPQPAQARYALPAGALVLTAALGLTAMVPPAGQAVTPRMQALIQDGLRAGSQADLPAPLRSDNVKVFLQNAHSPYTLQWDKDEKNRFAIPRPAASLASQSTVIARFENGYLLACVYPGATGDPECKDFK